MVTISIAGVDRTNFVAWDSLRIENILNKQSDRCTFKIRNFGDKIFKPLIGREVIIYDGATKIFGGIINKVDQALTTYKIVEYDVQCSDYTRLLDQHLVAETYVNMTINAIIADLIANWLPAGITMTQVDSTFVVQYIQFKYEQATTCIDQLANLVGADWYIDYDKDLYFKLPSATAAPVDLTDDGGIYVDGSLVIRRDSSQLRNSIIVRGGEYLGTEFTAAVRADGKQIVFNLPYGYSDFKATLTGNPLHVGIDYINSPDDYDALYNFNEKLLRFKESDRPSQNATLSFSGKPHLPVITKFKSQALIDAIFSAEGVGDGRYEYLVIDKSINSKEGARQRAQAEINTYGETLSEGEFVSEYAGFKAGQQIYINSAALGIAEYFIINRVISQMKDLDSMIYQISLITTKTMDFIALIKKILLDQIKQSESKSDESTDSTEILDIIETADETITISESVASSLSHNMQTETITAGESFTAQALNYAVVFVAGPQAPSTVKRVFICDGSRLG